MFGLYMAVEGLTDSMGKTILRLTAQHCASVQVGIITMSTCRSKFVHWADRPRLIRFRRGLDAARQTFSIWSSASCLLIFATDREFVVVVGP